MSILLVFFVFMLLITVPIVIWAARPSLGERAIHARISNIRNPRRSLKAESGRADIQEEQHATLSQRLDQHLKRYVLLRKIEQLLVESNSMHTPARLLIRGVQYAVVGGLVGGSLFRALWGAFICATVSGAWPILDLKIQRAKRLNAVAAALPAAADLMGRSLRAGHSMTQAIEVLAEQASQPLADEFSKVFQQQKLGVPLRDTLLELLQRVPSKDLQFLITAILVQRETGGDLIQILDKTAHVLQERIHVQGEVKVQTAQGRMTGWILSLLPVALLAIMSIFSRDYSQVLFRDPMGRNLLYGGATSILIGAMIIRRIVKVNF